MSFRGRAHVRNPRKSDARYNLCKRACSAASTGSEWIASGCSNDPVGAESFPLIRGKRSLLVDDDRDSIRLLRFPAAANAGSACLSAMESQETASVLEGRLTTQIVKALTAKMPATSVASTSFSLQPPTGLHAAGPALALTPSPAFPITAGIYATVRPRRRSVAGPPRPMRLLWHIPDDVVCSRGKRRGQIIRELPLRLDSRAGRT